MPPSGGYFWSDEDRVRVWLMYWESRATLLSIGRTLNLSKERIRQVIARTERFLRCHLRGACPMVGSNYDDHYKARMIGAARAFLNKRPTLYPGPLFIETQEERERMQYSWRD